MTREDELIANNLELTRQNDALRNELGELRAEAALIDQAIRNALSDRFGIEVSVSVPLPGFIAGL